MKTGILGGTFNPIHLAHLRIAEEVQQTCVLDRVLFIPAAEPPHKDIAGAVSFTQRLAMVEAAINNHPQFQSSDLEIRRSGKSFSVDTLEILRREDPQGEFYFIIGMDSYRDISSWKDFARIFSLSHLVIATRPDVLVRDPLDPLPVAMRKSFCYDDETGRILHNSGHELIFTKQTHLDISSTRIRCLRAAGQSIRHLVPSAVADYIEEHGLYRTPITKGSH
jgi:nicotinate-nucleotide adenylyltransferase